MTLGKYLALGTGLVSLLLIVLIGLHVAASIPAWVLPALVLAVCVAVVVG